jgi:hypothetical protein
VEAEVTALRFVDQRRDAARVAELGDALDVCTVPYSVGVIMTNRGDVGMVAQSICDRLGAGRADGGLALVISA